MGTDSTITMALIVAMIGVIGTIYNIYRTNKQDTIGNQSCLEEIRAGLLKANMKLDSQCGQLTDLSASIKATQKSVDSIKEEQIRQDMEIKALWRNVDELRGK